MSSPDVMSRGVETRFSGRARTSVDQPSLDSSQFHDIQLTSTPKRSKNNPGSIGMDSNRDGFLPGIRNGCSFSYSRRGDVSLSRCGLAVLLLGSLALAAAAATLVYFLVPCRNEDKNAVEDDLSWDIGDIHVRNADDKIRLLTNVIPSYYRLEIKPNFTSFTFEGKVTITLSTHKANVKHISLHSKDLEIKNGSVLTEEIKISLPLTPIVSRARRNAENIVTAPSISSTTSNLLLSEKTGSTESSVKTTPSNNNTTDFSLDTTQPTSTDSTLKTTPAVTELITTNGNKSSNLTMGSTKQPLTSTNTNKVTLGHEIPKFIETSTSEDGGTHITTSFPQTTIIQMKAKKVKIVSEEQNPSIDRLIFTLESHLKPHINYTLEINFIGTIDDSLTGFYKSVYKDFTDNATETLAVTQFEPTSARKAFPCFDEPHFKASFEISIARHKNQTVISNMPIEAEEPIPGDNMIWSHFQKSPLMSSYLVAFTISDLQAVDAQKDSFDRIPFKIWSRKELINQTKYAAEISPRILKFYEDYFGVQYALPKIDLLGIPDFSVGAMENWGMLTFRETSLLIDPDSDSVAAKKGVAMVIAHELAHQWFGNLVTMKWWTDLWLNEGFATYLEYLGVDHIEPEWKMLDQFSLDRMGVLSLDSIQSTRPVSTLVDDETQISQIFDDISYTKAASLLRMLTHILTEDGFHAGLVDYMKKWQFSNADQNDLWQSFTTAGNKVSTLPSHVTVANFMDSWTLQAGYPVIHVTRYYNNATATITQKRFYLSTPTAGMSDELWYVPISYAFSNSIQHANWSTAPVAWLEKTVNTTINIPDAANNTWLYVNVKAIGHYRVNYDLKNWKELEHGLDDNLEQFPPVTRAQLLDDAFNLARAGQLNYSVPLDLTKYMDMERDVLPWYAVLDNLELLNLAMQISMHYDLFQEYVSRLITPTLNTFNYITVADSSQDTILREHLISWACMIEDPECIKWAWKNYDSWIKQQNPNIDNPIPFSSRPTIYKTVARMGSVKEFDFLFERFENSIDPEVRSAIIESLPSTRITWKLNSLLEYSITQMDIHLTPQFWSGIDNELAAQKAFQFVINNWPRVFAKYSMVDDQILPHIIDGAFGKVSTEQQLRQFKQFIHANKGDLKSVSQYIKKNLERAVLTIQWGKKKMEDVERWLIKYAESKPSIINKDSTF